MIHYSQEMINAQIVFDASCKEAWEVFWAAGAQDYETYRKVEDEASRVYSETIMSYQK